MNWSSHQTLLLQLRSPRTSQMRQSSRRSTSTSAKHWPAAPMAERPRRLCLPGTMQTRKSQSSAWSRQQASGRLTPDLFRVHGSLRRWAFCRSHWQHSKRPAGIRGSRYCREQKAKIQLGPPATGVGATSLPSMADPPRRAADHRAVRGRAGGGVTPDGGTPDGGTPSMASTLAQRQDCLEQADQWKDGCETRGDMVCKVVCDSRHRFRVKAAVGHQARRLTGSSRRSYLASLIAPRSRHAPDSDTDHRL